MLGPNGNSSYMAQPGPMINGSPQTIPYYPPSNFPYPTPSPGGFRIRGDNPQADDRTFWFHNIFLVCSGE